MYAGQSTQGIRHGKRSSKEISKLANSRKHTYRSKGNKVELIATDLEIAIRSTLRAKVDNVGSFTVLRKPLLTLYALI